MLRGVCYYFGGGGGGGGFFFFLRKILFFFCGGGGGGGALYVVRTEYSVILFWERVRLAEIESILSLRFEKLG